MSNLKNIADILPEGLDESTVQAVFELVDSTINEQVAEKVGLLEAKVNAYLRTKVDRLKEQALAELSEENEVFRNARLFESVRTLMALELNGADEDNALSVVENEKLQGTIKVLNDKVSISEGVVEQLEGHKAQLLEEVENLVAARDEAFASSEQAVVVSQADVEINESKTQTGNEFLTDEVMKFMPFSSQK
jgi:hypothetical protein